jgi:hypothetical protein
MFGKKTDREEKQNERTDLVVHTIPDMFYGGKNPDIYVNHTSSVPTTHIKPKVSVAPVVHKHHVGLFVGIGIILLLLISGVSWYYLRGYMSQKSGVIPAPLDPPAPVVIVPTNTVPVANPVTTIVIATSTGVADANVASSSDIAYIFPTFGLFDTADLDADGLTDMEESLYGTDPGIWDTDGDGYYDGLEVQHLYSPLTVSPAKITTESIVREYVHPQFGYRFYYPSSWQVALVDTEGEQLLISAQTGEYIEVIRSSRLNNELFVSWYARVIGAAARYTDFSVEKNRFAFEYMRRPDWLAGFFESPDAVYTLIYHTGNNQDVVYRRSMSLVIQSFVPFGSAAPLPEQDVLPTTTTTVR